MTSLTFDAATLVLEIKAGLLDTAFIFTSPNRVILGQTLCYQTASATSYLKSIQWRYISPTQTTHISLTHTTHISLTHTAHISLTHAAHISQTYAARISQTQTIHILQTQTKHISQTQSAHISLTHTAHISQTQTTHISQTQTTHISQTPNILKQLLSLSHSFQLLPTATNNPNHATTTWHRSPLTLLRLFWK